MGARFGLEGWPEKVVHRDLRKVSENLASEPRAGGAVPPAETTREAPGSHLPFDVLCASTSLQPTAPPATLMILSVGLEASASPRRRCPTARAM